MFKTPAPRFTRDFSQIANRAVINRRVYMKTLSPQPTTEKGNK